MNKGKEKNFLSLKKQQKDEWTDKRCVNTTGLHARCGKTSSIRAIKIGMHNVFGGEYEWKRMKGEGCRPFDKMKTLGREECEMLAKVWLSFVGNWHQSWPMDGNWFRFQQNVANQADEEWKRVRNGNLFSRSNSAVTSRSKRRGEEQVILETLLSSIKRMPSFGRGWWWPFANHCLASSSRLFELPRTNMFAIPSSHEMQQRHSIGMPSEKTNTKRKHPKEAYRLGNKKKR